MTLQPRARARRRHTPKPPPCHGPPRARASARPLRPRARALSCSRPRAPPRGQTISCPAPRPLSFRAFVTPSSRGAPARRRAAAAAAASRAGPQPPPAPLNASGARGALGAPANAPWPANAPGPATSKRAGTFCQGPSPIGSQHWAPVTSVLTLTYPLVVCTTSPLHTPPRSRGAASERKRGWRGGTSRRPVCPVCC